MAIWEVLPEPACSLALPPTESERLPHRGQKGNHPEAWHVSAQAGGLLWGPKEAEPSPQVKSGALTALGTRQLRPGVLGGAHLGLRATGALCGGLV